MFRLELQPAYVIHSRPYRDTSLLVELFTPEYGRVAAVARGVRVRKSPRRALINPFIPLLVSLQGRSPLKLLTHVEAVAPAIPLRGNTLFAGLYLNELLARLLPEWDAHVALYRDYTRAVASLQQADRMEPVLRHFETALLRELGYEINYREEAETGAPVTPGQIYRLETARGFIATHADSGHLHFPGENLLAIARGDYQGEAVCRAAKQINRRLLAPLLGDRPLQARSLFRTLA